ncbi:tRNA 2-thiocytidine biosynthesis TtcA family protein [Clostridium tetani]|uniref:tRNA 2-thiocytidine biosynthesis protein TtcA n=1 Tax=Clostridium tetani TaxID=1513 RepID=A0ABY0ESP5_CLOTA|nr:tRNA 2-thiocytidine biosynthesis TtcA family protein [Clostridium tetani]CDI48378.1 PP family ATPase [Clostridium tetani 12124569]KHO40281.1 ATPase [Clostridium tetani]RXI41030.1 tRNA 2-thiocytidine biosynthesis protein TtcA [Clostridium tetani]RXI58553.1 tRNA 2-thiocytidine biosynthesis protein TtcA [Clostridium tetani]RXI73265.1 tRNA 2-thiocytidine biosynthesis protein TtcA [Clostridium tetani]
MKQLLSKFRKAITDFSLIEDGDNIAIGLSGGKDSLALLYLLSKYRVFSPEKFNIIAITIDPGTDMDFSPLKNLCQELDIPLHIIDSNIKEIVFDIRKEKNPCSLCANLRRGILNDNAKKLGCNKVALGHHKNDAIETLLLSMFYEGRISCFLPKTYLDRKDITVIRPMVYIEEAAIKRTSVKYNFPIIQNPCPANGFTKRESIKNLIESLKKDFPDLENRLLGALTNSKQLCIWDK